MKVQAEANFKAVVSVALFDGELAVMGNLGIQQHSAEDFEKTIVTGDYLSRVGLQTSNSEKCKAGEFPVNHYALIEGGNYIDLEKEVDILVITWHPKAIDMSDREEIVTAYDPKTDMFQAIQTKAGGKDSGCMFGPEYLIYIPGQKKFSTFFMGSKSARKESRAMSGLLEKAATLKSKFIESGKFKWQAPVVTACSTAFEMPSMEDIKANVKKFTDSEVTPEAAPEAATGRAR